MTVGIVPMEKRHIPELARLEAICFSEPWTREGLEAELEIPTAAFSVAVVGETGDVGYGSCRKVLGYAGMHAVCGECYVDNVAVFPESRGAGVGRKLVESLLDWAREQNGLFVTLEVRPSNQAALGLYRSLGFQPVGRRKDFYTHPREDALLLTCFLSSEKEGDGAGEVQEATGSRKAAEPQVHKP